MTTKLGGAAGAIVGATVEEVVAQEANTSVPASAIRMVALIDLNTYAVRESDRGAIYPIEGVVKPYTACL
ncbi:MAG: hypothetical protein ACI9NT_001848 [Bacteroidia bacterium]|jgi:hypothetical protein